MPALHLRKRHTSAHTHISGGGGCGHEEVAQSLERSGNTPAHTCAHQTCMRLTGVISDLIDSAALLGPPAAL